MFTRYHYKPSSKHPFDHIKTYDGHLFYVVRDMCCGHHLFIHCCRSLNVKTDIVSTVSSFDHSSYSLPSTLLMTTRHCHHPQQRVLLQPERREGQRRPTRHHSSSGPARRALTGLLPLPRWASAPRLTCK